MGVRVGSVLVNGKKKGKRLEDLRVLKLEGCLDSGLTVGISSLVSVVPQGQ